MGRMKKETAIEVLGLNGDEDEAEIKRAYKRMSLKTHPDKCKDPGATAKFQEVSEAYLCLTNPNYHSDDDGEYSSDNEDGHYHRGGMSDEDYFDLFREMFFFSR
ncbi:unnamed protein product, partial [Choristocarpus tenellus]